MNTTKQAKPDFPIHDLFVQRWSPCAFAERAVPKQELCSLFEAARWTASSFNEQPWSYIVATKEDADEFARLLSCLTEGNQPWARRAPVLAIGCTNVMFAYNNERNIAAEHDLGAASASLALEATSRRLFVRQMIGILPHRIRELYEVPDHVLPVTGLAIGYLGDPNDLPDKYRQRDLAPRIRKPLKELIFTGRWGDASSILSKSE